MTEEVFEPDTELEEVDPEDLDPDQVDPEVEDIEGYEEVSENGDGNSSPDDLGPDLVSEEDQAS